MGRLMQGVGGNIEHIYNNGVSEQVIFAFPTALRVGRPAARRRSVTPGTRSIRLSLFVNDTGRRPYAQRRRSRGTATRGSSRAESAASQQRSAASCRRRRFPERLLTWNVFAPRIGVVYDITGDGKTVIKANYGLYWHNPGAASGSNANPNTGREVGHLQLERHQRRIVAWQPGEEGRSRRRARGRDRALDPNIKAPYTHEASVWLERQLTDTMGVRGGFVYKTEDDLIARTPAGPRCRRTRCRSPSSTSASTACAARRRRT